MDGKRRRELWAGMACVAAAYAGLSALAKAKEEPQGIDGNNPYAGHVLAGPQNLSFYETRGKRALDKALSFSGLLALAPIYGAISLAIKLDDPGSVFFKQKRVGKDGRFFYLHKFRSMKMSTPHDVPTHMLKNPDQYITRIGKILRKTSLDELPQIWDIFRGRMSVIGPRPALWNQEDLIAEREKYAANSVMPGLTGLAQISGRDELEIAEKARLDGEYTAKLRKGGMTAFAQDFTCFWGTVRSVLRHDGVVEGGTANKRRVDR